MDPIRIPAAEQGIVRVFAIDLEDAEAEEFAKDPSRLAEALGVPEINPEYVDVFPMERLAGIELSRFLEDGHGVAEADLARDRAELDRMSGHVAVVTSRAFGSGDLVLKVVSPLRLVGTYAEDRPPVSFEALPSESARGAIPPPAFPPPPPMRGGRAGKIMALLVIAAAFIALAFLGGSR